jgi:predicted pyridoxine 5'-phosphate oxidase superfamily flavin-nucleotide-binding protein
VAEELGEVENVVDVEEADSTDESRLARKLANFGMALAASPVLYTQANRGRRFLFPKACYDEKRERLAMGNIHTTIDDSIKKFIDAQPLFFVATAPLDSTGHINVSPKGLDTLRILDPRTVAYLDLTGSGIETISHLKENGRIVLMFCAFQGPPKILRLHGRGKVVEQGQKDSLHLAAHFAEHQGKRAIIVIEVSRISDSCGYSVPLLQYQGERDQLTAWSKRLGSEGLTKYREEKNQKSIDQIPGLEKLQE